MLPITAYTLRIIGPAFRTGGLYDLAQKTITDSLGPFLIPLLSKYEINTVPRLAHFLGQTCEESGGFRSLVEFSNGSEYEGRKDLGNTYPGDGPKFKGRGLIQITGRTNYTQMGNRLSLDLIHSPELAEEPGPAFEIACLYWTERRLNYYADRDDLLIITRRINGGTNGLAARQEFTDKARAVLQRMVALESRTADVAAVNANTIPVLFRGSTGLPVEQLQRALQTAGYPVKIDGDFGPATDGAVRAYQETRPDLGPANGAVDSIWWAALIASLPPTT